MSNSEAVRRESDEEVTKEDATDAADNVEQSKESTGSHSDVGYASMHDQPGVIDNVDNNGDTEETKTMTKSRSFSIVKPPPSLDDEQEESEVKRGASRALFGDKSASSESLEIIEHSEAASESPDKKGRLPTLVEISPSEGLETPDGMEKVPVTEDDPLGALSSHNTPDNSPARDKIVST